VGWDIIINIQIMLRLESWIRVRARFEVRVSIRVNFIAKAYTCT
jgi:hypothetical protein